MLKGKLAFNRTGGFTLVETVVVVAATAVILSVLLPAFLSVGRIYRETEKANLLQIKSSRAIGFIKDSIQSSDDFRIVSGEPKPLDGYTLIWCKDDKLYYKYPGKMAAVYMEDTGFRLNFTGNGRLLEIELDVLTDGEPYTIESAVSLTGLREITGTNGTGIQFKAIQDTN